MIMSSLDARQHLNFICHLFQYKRRKKTLTCAFDKMLSCVLVFKLFLNKVCFVYIKGQRIKREASCEAGPTVARWQEQARWTDEELLHRDCAWINRDADSEMGWFVALSRQRGNKKRERITLEIRFAHNLYFQVVYIITIKQCVLNLKGGRW